MRGSLVAESSESVNTTPLIVSNRPRQGQILVTPFTQSLWDRTFDQRSVIQDGERNSAGPDVALESGLWIRLADETGGAFRFSDVRSSPRSDVRIDCARCWRRYGKDRTKYGKRKVGA